ncbi:heavy-metal-associated domain-containing protein [Kribbella sp. NBC_00889]|uniref:heavy-metal-associated domain-containing protein n=1 Tax=Kribbella sp. NBC_00889 TaxID=2975974 RepID=UPI00386A881C|nr:cation transporter [Kribbella sp. NBC_00889]
MIDESALAGRSGVARLLTELAYDVFDGPVPIATAPFRLTCTVESVAFSTDQAEFVRSRLWPCPPNLVTSASHRVTWVDSEGVTNVAHCGSLGPTVPIVAREATLALWARLRADARLAERAEAVDSVQSDLLAAITTDKVPAEILRTGVDAAARVLIQHAYLAGTTPYDEPAGFAEEVPDMTCQHCIRTITKAVGEFGVAPPEFDLETKRVVASFGSAEVRAQSFAAIRACGYTVVPGPR